MIARIFLTLALLLLIRPTILTGQPAEPRPLWDWLLHRARAIDFDQLAPHRGIQALLSMAESCHTLGKAELAREFYDRATATAAEDEKRSYHFSFFRYAIETDQLQLATQIAQESEADVLLDKLDLEKYRRGDADAVKHYPRGEMTFYNAMELANVFVELGDYERAEQFVADIKITEENDPADVAGITLENIAKQCRDAGDMANAKRYIDKAKEIAGNQFYTGYAINITHRSIHGVLTEDLEKFAQQGARYPGHMGRELVLLLASELVRTGHFAEAKQTFKYLEKPEDVQSCLRNIAASHARCGDMEAALQTVAQLDDAQAKNIVRLAIAEVLCETGKLDAARKVSDFILGSLRKEKEIDEVQERNYRTLSRLYGTLGCQAQLEQLFAQANTPQLKADCIRHAVRGFVAARKNERPSSR